MAELHLERKERTIWPWIVAALVVLALLIWFLMDRGPRVAETDVEAPVATAPGPDVARAPGAAGDFQEWVRETQTQAAAGHDHNYTADGIRRLADAIGETTERDVVNQQALDDQLSRMRSYADSLQRDAESLRHAHYARSAFVLGADLLADIDRTDHPQRSTNVDQLRSAAGAVNPDTPLLEQMGAVERYFERASETVGQMTRADATGTQTGTGAGAAQQPGTGN